MNTAKKTGIKTAFFILVTLLTTTLFPAFAHATFVSPRQVMIEDGQRVAVVTINNGKDETMVYTFGWEERAQSPAGESLLLKDGETTPGFKPASSMLQFSPRRVVVGPKQTQKIRILVKRPADLPEGEYHSHLLIKPVPLGEGGPSSPDIRGGMGGSLQIRANVSIPVFVRHGATNIDIKLDDAYLYKKDGQSRAMFRFLNNSTRSIYLKPELLCYTAGAEEPSRTIIQSSKIYAEAKTVTQDAAIPKALDLNTCKSIKVEFSGIDDFEYKRKIIITRDLSWR